MNKKGNDDEGNGVWPLFLGLLGVTLFALSFPMTRLAVGSVQAPALSPWFIAFGRAAVAGVLSLLYLVFTRSPWPKKNDWWPLIVVALGVVFGFPLLSTLALRQVQSIHASVFLGLLPLTTAAVGAVLARQQPSRGFWLCAVLGAALVMTFVLMTSPHFEIAAADLMLVAAMLCAAVGYALGAQVTQRLGAERVICWALVISLPVTLPSAVFAFSHSANTGALAASVWLGFIYLGVFSMWLGFFAWYRALALGGTVRISQLQLLQPFLSMLFAVPLLGERLDYLTLLFAVAVIAVVFVGKKMPISKSSSMDTAKIPS